MLYLSLIYHIVVLRRLGGAKKVMHVPVRGTVFISWDYWECCAHFTFGRALGDAPTL